MGNEARFTISAKDKTKATISRVEKSLNSLAGTASKLIGLSGGISAALISKQIIENTIRQENALKQLEARIKSTGGVAGHTRDDLVKMAQGLQSVTTYGDEAVEEMQSLLLTFTRIRGEEFTLAQEAILNVATAMGTDLKSAALQVGKALNDPVSNLGALSRAGIQFSKDQKEMIKALSESGREANAQQIILRELETQFGGAARAARETFGGALSGLKNAFGDLLEADSLGGTTESIEKLTRLLQDPQTVEAAQMLTKAMITGFTKVVEVVSEIPKFIEFISESTAEFIHGSADPVERVTENIKDLEGELKALQALEQQRRMDPNMLMVGVPKSAKIAEVTAELERLRQVRNRMIQEADQAKMVQTAQSVQENINNRAAAAMPASNQDFDQAIPGGGLNQNKSDEELERIRKFLRSREEIELEAYLHRKEFILTNMEEGESRNRLLEDLHKQHEETLTHISQVEEDKRRKASEISWMARASTAVQLLQFMTAAQADESKKAFELNKKAQIAQTLMTTYEMATKAYNAMAGIPYIGPVLGALAAAAASAFGFKQVRLIKSQTWQGGGGGGAASAPSSNAGASSAQAPTVPQSTQQQQQQSPRQVQVIISGPVDRQYLKDALLPALQEEINENDVTFINADSAQARELNRSVA